MSYLNPIYKNIHSFRALEDTAILDILIPNYDDETRFCNFYMEVDDDNQEVKIEEIIQNNENKANGLHMNGNQVKNEGGMDEEPINSKFKSPGEKTTILFILPPFDMHVKLLDYEGQKPDED
jgi:PCO_ADO